MDWICFHISAFAHILNTNYITSTNKILCIQRFQIHLHHKLLKNSLFHPSASLSFVVFGEAFTVVDEGSASGNASISAALNVNISIFQANYVVMYILRQIRCILPLLRACNSYASRRSICSGSQYERDDLFEPNKETSCVSKSLRQRHSAHIFCCSMNYMWHCCWRCRNEFAKKFVELTCTA